MWTCGFVLVLCILFGSFIEDNVFWVVISSAGAILFAAYLLYDLQKLMGGRYLAVHPDDYIYAAVQVCHTTMLDDYHWCQVEWWAGMLGARSTYAR